MFLSIIIPVYNAEKFIVHCLESIWSQNLPVNEYEVICVDDCSKDNSVAVIQQQMACHANLKLLHNPENLRAGGARNHGVKEAQGEYICFIDADDYYHPGGLAHACALLKQENLDILVCNFVRELPGTTGKELVHHYASQEPMEPEEYRMVNGFIPYAPWQWLFRRSLMTEVQLQFAEHVCAEDVDWTHRLVLRAGRMRYAPICLTHYVLHASGLTAKSVYSSTNIYCAFQAANRLYDVAELWKNPENKEYVYSVAGAYITAALKGYLFFFGAIRKKVDFLQQYADKDWKIASIWKFALKFPFCYSFFSNMVSPLAKLALAIRSRYRYRGIKR